MAKSEGVWAFIAVIAAQYAGHRSAPIFDDNPPVPIHRSDLFYLNGKFLAQRTTGVQRVATQQLAALDALGSQLPGHWTVLCPAGVRLPQLRHVASRTLGPSHLSLHAWEQGVLPWACRNGLLVNLAGAAPWAVHRQVCMIHDAAVFDHPEAYARSFVAWYRWLFKCLAHRGTPLLTVSEFSRQRLALRLGIDPVRLRVVPNGADHLQAVVPDMAVLERHGLVGHRFLLAVASDNPTKNLPALVAAYASLPMRDDLRLVLVGGHNRRVFADSGAPDDPPGVVRTGPLDDGPLRALYGHAMALVFPSLYEGFGLPPLEAMACGCPVLAAQAGALPEVCGDAALYFDPRSVSGIAAAMGAIAQDEGLRARLRAAGSRRAQAYTWHTSARILANALGALHP